MIDTIELSSAATRGTEAPALAPRTGIISRVFGARHAHRLREWRTVLDTVSPPDVHRARITQGLTAIERFALTEAWQ